MCMYAQVIQYIAPVLAPNCEVGCQVDSVHTLRATMSVHQPNYTKNFDRYLEAIWASFTN